MSGPADREVLRLVGDSLNRVPLTRADICLLLSFGEHTPESVEVIDAAKRFSLESAGGIGEVGVQIGTHIGPCIADCAFCSFAVSNANFQEFIMSEPELHRYLDQIVSEGTVSSVSLMTVHNFDFDTFLDRVAFARGILPDTVRLVSNTGDLDDWQARELKKAGIDWAYHALRLGEGLDNSIEPYGRYRTIRNLREAGIRVATGIEPIGPEHSVEEIVDGFFRAHEMGCEVCSASARVPVPGTPLFSNGCISERRLMQIRSVLLLGSIGMTPGGNPFYGGVYGGFGKVLAEYSNSPKDLEDRSEKGLGRTVSWARSVLKEDGYTHVRCIDGSVSEL